MHNWMKSILRCKYVGPYKTQDFPGDSVVKYPPPSAEDMGSTPGSGRSPAEGNGNPLQQSCLGNPRDSRA